MALERSSTLGPRDRPTADEIVVPGSDAPATASALIPQTSALRYQAGHSHARAIQLDRLVNSVGVAERATRLEHLSIRSLLDALSTRWGMSWTLIAKLSDVSVQTLRNWRAGDPSSPENRAKCASVVALVETLSDQLLIEDPASWLEIPLASTSLSLADLVAAGRSDLVLDYAGSRVSEPERLLNLFDPDWRERYDRRFETFIDSDGQYSIRKRVGR
jgi:hypothetical protein